MLKFGRNYRMKFKIGTVERLTYVNWQEEITVEYPLTLNFNISRGLNQIVNNASFQLINLSEDTRAKLYKDINDFTKYIWVELYAGYGEDKENLPLCFAGEVWSCESFKEGKGTEFITDLTCMSGIYGKNYCFTNATYAKGTKPEDIIKAICSDFVNLKLKGISQEVLKELQPPSRDYAICGKTIEVLEAYVGSSNVVIDNGYIYIAKADDVVHTGLMTLNIDSGLLGTPRRRDTYLNCDLIFEPRLQEIQKLTIESKTLPYLNGTYRVSAFSHSGIISGAVCGSCITRVSLDISGKLFKELKEML